jgi:redox-sensitive bicupin YhaK (pirin superfamily)
MSAILQQFPLGPQWPTIDPFLFTAHHLDHYPAANDRLGPAASLDGRAIGQDFAGKDGWNMYHGTTVPGFPQHPHRGFETITYVRRGRIDHADSLGATARFGDGDTQWMTAGSGIQHCEMFPLLRQDEPNPLELFQIWLNLPATDKMVDPYFTMLWSHDTPTFSISDGNDRSVEITVIAGEVAGQVAATPPPNSWAARPEADIGVWHLSFDPDATWSIPAASGPETMRVVYAFEGSSLTIDGETVSAGTGVLIDCTEPHLLTAGGGGVEVMVLQGRPIGEPVARYGPFVMNTEEEIQQAFADYQRDQFGGWPWPSPEPNHGPEKGRFAIHADGRLEEVEPVR